MSSIDNSYNPIIQSQNQILLSETNNSVAIQGKLSSNLITDTCKINSTISRVSSQNLAQHLNDLSIYLYGGYIQAKEEVAKGNLAANKE